MSPRRSPGLVLGEGLILPLDLATSSIAILGSSGSGKSNTSVRLFEQLVKNSIPAVGIDPKGDWWGIRSAGTAPGLSVPIFGGLRGDGPLEANMGQRLAELLVVERLSALLDVSRLSLGNRARFLIDFLHRLFELHQEDPHPRHIICEEAHRLIPQQIPKGETMAAQLKEAAARVVLEGRAFGLGFTAPSQRSARLNNDVLEEVRTLIVHRTGGPADQDAILRWVRHHHLREDVMATLAEMEDGNAWVWSPQYLKIVGRYQMCRRETFDSGATPKVGEVRRAARTMADVDMGAIKDALADVIERAEASDPAKLTVRVRALEHRLHVLKTEHAAEVQTLRAMHESQKPVVERVEVPVLDEDLVARLEAALSPAAGVLGELHEMVATHRQALDVGLFSPRAPARPVVALDRLSRWAETPTIVAHHGAPPPPAAPAPATGPLNDGDLSVLAVLAAFPEGRTVKQLALLTGQSAGGGSFNRRLTKLRQMELLAPGSPLVATEEGRRMGAAFTSPPPAAGPALLAYWKAKLPSGAARLLDAFVDAFPSSLSREQAAAAADYEAGGGAFNRMMAKLVALDLLYGAGRGLYRAAAELVSS